MFVDVAKTPTVQFCRIAGYGYTRLGDEWLYDNRRFVEEILSPTGRLQLYAKLELSSHWSEAERLAAVDHSFQERPGIISRRLYKPKEVGPGPTIELAIMAAQAALENAQCRAEDLDFILASTNTGPGYPSLADFVKLGLGVPSGAGANDVVEACSGGLAALFDGWRAIRSGVCRRVLVVAAENALNLVDHDYYFGSNLFGSGAIGVVLEAADLEQFLLFEQDSQPFEKQINWVRKEPPTGFVQEGGRVHKLIGRLIPAQIAKGCATIGLDPAKIAHIFFHMPSGRTYDLLVEEVAKQLPTFAGRIPENVRREGNVSAAGALKLIAESAAAGQIQPGDICLSYSFGSGISWAGTAFTY